VAERQIERAAADAAGSWFDSSGGLRNAVNFGMTESAKKVPDQTQAVRNGKQPSSKLTKR
jgi:hypothetical protein